MADPKKPDVVQQAREAAARGAFQEALDLFLVAETDGLLETPDLPLLADMAYATGNVDLTITAWERVYVAYKQSGDSVAAAGAAARIAMHLLFDTALMAPVRGWLSRADRLLEGQPDTAAHAWCAVVHAYERLLSGDLEAALPWARRAVAVGSQQDAAACAIGRVAEARLLILGGEVDQGLAQLDEAGVSTVSGELDPLSTGVVYCELVCALQGLAQYDLAQQWTEAMDRWARTKAIGSLHGRCRVHRAEILRLRGACDEAETEAVAACEELRPYLRRELGWPLCEIGRIRLRRGDIDGAERALLQAHDAGWDARPDLALVHLAKGDINAASAIIHDALDRPMRVPSKERPPNSGLQRAPLLEAQVEIAIAANNLDRARSAADELAAIAERFQSAALVASAVLARGRVRLAEGDVMEAEAQLSKAARLWSEIGAPYETAQARTALAKAYLLAGSEHLAALELGAAQAMLKQIQSRPDDAPGVPVDKAMPAHPASKAHNGFHREGDYWSVIFEGHGVRIKDLKGMRYLAHLLTEPEREFHVLDLVALETRSCPPSAQGAPPASHLGLGDSGEVLDEQAKKSYQRRLDEIDADLEEAQAIGDPMRTEQATSERDFLLRELSRAFGLGGKGRRAGCNSERARAGVTRALRQAITRIADHHPSLGKHLDRAVRTGTYCSYRPDALIADWR